MAWESLISDCSLELADAKDAAVAELRLLLGEREIDVCLDGLSVLLLAEELGLDQVDGEGSLVPPGVVEDQRELPGSLSLDPDFSLTPLSGVLD